MKGTFTLLLSLLLSVLFINAEGDDVIVLTVDNFEHLTQVSTGATTGPWLIEFYAPWCGHCKKLEPTYKKVATELKGKVNVAKVDAQAHPSLSKRFGVKGYPTIKFFNHGKMYNYKGRRGLEDFEAFVNDGYKASGVTSSVVPGQESLSGQILSEIETTSNDFKSLVKTKKNVLLVTFVTGLVLGMFLCCMCCNKKSTTSADAKVKKN